MKKKQKRPLPLDVVRLQGTIWDDFEEAMGGRSPDDVSAAAEIDRTSWYNYKEGRTSPSIVRLFRIAQTLERRLIVKVRSPGVGGEADTEDGTEMVHSPKSEEVAEIMDKLSDEQRGQVLAFVQGMRTSSIPTELPPRLHTNGDTKKH
jgi:predicted transcriptional regulator